MINANENKKILICDDEVGVRESLKLILSDLYEILEAENGKECLKILEKTKDIRLVLLDINMPGMNGIDTLANINKNFPKIPSIMITGYNEEYYKDATRCLQAVDYICKPFTGQEIKNKCKALMEE